MPGLIVQRRLSEHGAEGHVGGFGWAGPAIDAPRHLGHPLDRDAQPIDSRRNAEADASMGVGVPPRRLLQRQQRPAYQAATVPRAKLPRWYSRESASKWLAYRCRSSAPAPATEAGARYHQRKCLRRTSSEVVATFDITL